MGALEKLTENPNVKKYTLMGIQKAIAEAGNSWAKLTPAQRAAKKPEDLEKLVMDSIDGENMFLGPDGANTKDIAKTYAKEVIARSEALDVAQGKAKGANLRMYLDEVSTVVRAEYKTPEEFDAAKTRASEGSLTLEDYAKFQKIKTATGAAAVKYLGQTENGKPDGKPLTLQDDLLQMMRADSLMPDGKTPKPEKDRKFKEDQAKEPSAQVKKGGGKMGLLLMILLAILGMGDMGDMLGELLGGLLGGGKEEEQMAQPQFNMKPVDQIVGQAQAMEKLKEIGDVGKALLDRAGLGVLGNLASNLNLFGPKPEEKGGPVPPR